MKKLYEYLENPWDIILFYIAAWFITFMAVAFNYFFEIDSLILSNLCVFILPAVLAIWTGNILTNASHKFSKGYWRNNFLSIAGANSCVILAYLLISAFPNFFDYYRDWGAFLLAGIQFIAYPIIVNISYTISYFIKLQ